MKTLFCIIKMFICFARICFYLLDAQISKWCKLWMELITRATHTHKNMTCWAGGKKRVVLLLPSLSFFMICSWFQFVFIYKIEIIFSFAFFSRLNSLCIFYYENRAEIKCVCTSRTPHTPTLSYSHTWCVLFSRWLIDWLTDWVHHLF